MKLKDKSLTAGDVIFDDNVRYSNCKNEFDDIVRNINHEKSSESEYTNGWLVPDYAHFTDFDTQEPINMNGWKIHISPTFKNVVRVLKIVIDYAKECEKNNNYITFKFMRDLDKYKSYISNENLNVYDYESQRGKFITIYPKNDEQAREIADTLHEKFDQNRLRNDNDFISIKNDFQIYPGIYTRLANYKDIYENTGNKVGIDVNELMAHLNANNINVGYKNYKHPFKELRFNNKILPKNVCAINDLFAVKSIIKNTREICKYINNPYFDYMIRLFKDMLWYFNIKVKFDEISKDDHFKELKNKWSKYYNPLKTLLDRDFRITNKYFKNYLNRRVISDEEIGLIKSLILSVDDFTRLDYRLNNIFSINTNPNINNQGRLYDFINNNGSIYKINNDGLKMMNNLAEYQRDFYSSDEHVKKVCSIMWNCIDYFKFTFGFNYELTENEEERRRYIRDLYDEDIDYKDVIKYNDIVDNRVMNVELARQRYKYQRSIDKQIKKRNRN